MKATFILTVICLLAIIINPFRVETAKTTTKRTSTTTKLPIKLEDVMKKLESLEAKLESIWACACNITSYKYCINPTLSSDYASVIQTIDFTSYGYPAYDSLVLKNGNILQIFSNPNFYYLATCNLTKSSCSELARLDSNPFCFGCYYPNKLLPDGNIVITYDGRPPTLNLYNSQTGQLISKAFYSSYSYLVLQNGNLFIQSGVNSTFYCIFNPYSKTTIATKYIPLNNQITIARMTVLPNNQIALLIRTSIISAVFSILILNADDLSEIRSFPLDKNDKIEWLVSLNNDLIAGYNYEIGGVTYYNIWNISTGSLINKILNADFTVKRLTALDNGFFAVRPIQSSTMNIYNPYKGKLVKQIQLDPSKNLPLYVESVFSLGNGNMGETFMNYYTKKSFMNIRNTQIQC